LAALATITYVFFIDLCGLIYQCGCRSLWLGAAAQCNIHHAGMKHCPFCTLSNSSYTGLILVVVAAQGVLVWRESWLRAALAFPLLVLAEAIVLGFFKGYWF
jgi:hypothetical protein